MSDNAACWNCRFWRRKRWLGQTDFYETDVTGDCCKRAPMPVLDSKDGRGRREYPETDGHDFCGEHILVDGREEPKTAEAIYDEQQRQQEASHRAQMERRAAWDRYHKIQRNGFSLTTGEPLPDPDGYHHASYRTTHGYDREEYTYPPKDLF